MFPYLGPEIIRWFIDRHTPDRLSSKDADQRPEKNVNFCVVGQFESGTGTSACAPSITFDNSCDVYQRRGGGTFIFFKLTHYRLLGPVGNGGKI
jgi:hypothetical protein